MELTAVKESFRALRWTGDDEIPCIPHLMSTSTGLCMDVDGRASWHRPAMPRVFIGSEAVAAGLVTEYQLANDHQRVLPDVYAETGPLSLHDRTLAAWKWSKGRGVIADLAAAAWHGAKWVEAGTPIELNLPDSRSHRGLHPHIKGLARVPSVLAQVDAGAESPQETKLRLTLIDAGFPRPQTQIPVRRPDGRRYFLDMGWPELMVAVEYDGEHHRTDRESFASDVARAEYLASVGWIIIRVLAGHRQRDIVERVRRARLSRQGG